MRRGLGVLLVGLFLFQADAFGAGFEYPENHPIAVGRAGASIASVNGAEAVYLNPGALTKISSWSASLSANLTDYRLCLERSPFSFPYMGGEATIEYEDECNQSRTFVAPMVFGALRLSKIPLVIGGGVYGPSANGRLRYNRMPRAAEPGDPEGVGAAEPSLRQRTVQRPGGAAYMLTDMDILVFYPSLSLAYEFESIGLSLGVTGQLVVGIISYGLGVDAAGIALGASGPVDSAVTEISEEKPGMMSYTSLSTSGLSATAILGAHWEPIPSLAIGASWRPRHLLSTSGELDVEFPPGLSDQNLAMTDRAVELDIQFPHMFKFGIQYKHLSGEQMLFDVELAGTYEMWSDLHQFAVRPGGRVQDNPAGGTPGQLINRELGALNILKHYQDAWSVRLGGAYHGLMNSEGTRGLILRLGGFYEHGATDPSWAHLDYFSPNRVGFSIGGSVHIGNFSVDLGLLHTLDSEMNVSASEANFELLNPLWVCEMPETQAERDACGAYQGSGPGHAINAGTFRHGLTILSLGVSVDF